MGEAAVAGAGRMTGDAAAVGGAAVRRGPRDRCGPSPEA